MAELSQDQPQASESTATQDQPISPESTGLSAEELAKYGADPEQDATPAHENDGQAPPADSTPGVNSDESVRYHQSVASRAQAEMFAMRQQMQEFLARVPINQPAPPAPPDPTTDPIGHLRWEIRQSAVQQREEIMKAWNQQLQGFVQQAQETTFAQQHPDVPVEELRAFQQERGIARLDDAYALYTMGRKQSQLAQAVQRDTIKTLTNKPGANAQPVRTPSGEQSGKISMNYAKLYGDYVAANGKPNWSPALMKAFMTQTDILERERSQRR